MIKRLQGWVILSGMLFSLCALAQTPYTITITVKSQSEADRLVAFKDGLTQLVNKISKDPTAATKLNINSMSPVLPFVDRYTYKKIRSTEDEGLDLGEARDLVIQFNQIAIDNLLKDLTNGTSSADLHHLTLWLAVTQNGRPDVLTSSNISPDVSQTLSGLGHKKNLEIILPLMDIDDINKVSVPDVDQINLLPVQQASVRYGADQILIGSIKPAGANQWVGHWLLWWNKQRIRWDTNATSYQNAMVDGISHAADLLANPGMMTPAEEANENHFVISVSGIDNVSDYAEIQSYLQQLPIVSQLQIVRAKSSNIVFDVIISGDKNSLLQALERNKHLIPLPPTTDRELNYTWSSANAN